jgi:hypothetical protein
MLGDAVEKPADLLVRVAGTNYLHLVSAVDPDRARVQISNNRGRVNGWTGHARVYGICTLVNDVARPRTRGPRVASRVSPRVSRFGPWRRELNRVRRGRPDPIDAFRVERREVGELRGQNSWLPGGASISAADAEDEVSDHDGRRPLDKVDPAFNPSRAHSTARHRCRLARRNGPGVPAFQTTVDAQRTSPRSRSPSPTLRARRRSARPRSRRRAEWPR